MIVVGALVVAAIVVAVVLLTKKNSPFKPVAKTSTQSTPSASPTPLSPAQITWRPVDSGTNEDLYGLGFADPTHGIAVGAHGVAITTGDGGATWTTSSLGAPKVKKDSICASDIAMIDPTHACVAAFYWGNESNPVEGDIYVTTDGGATWLQQYSLPGVAFYGVTFADATHGWVVGTGGTIIATADGGATWTKQTSGTTANLEMSAFADANSGVAVAYYPKAIVLRTSDGGATWTQAYSGTKSQALFWASFADPDHCWAVGYSGLMLRSIDGGSTWVTSASGTTKDLYCVNFVDATTGWALGAKGTMLATTDGGATWTKIASSTTKDLWSIKFPDPLHVCVIGNGGTVLVAGD